MSRTLLRAGVLLGTTALVALASAAPALAHVTANGTVQKGGYGVVTFRVPNEDDTAGTVAVTVNLPADHPFSSVRTTPIAGWTATPNEVTLNPPLKDDDGNAITKTVGSVTFKANPGTRIGPGQYMDFPLSLGPFPTDVDVLQMPAAQTYDNGKVVNWADPPNADGSEPEHPAPSVTLAAATRRPTTAAMATAARRRPARVRGHHRPLAGRRGPARRRAGPRLRRGRGAADPASGEVGLMRRVVALVLAVGAALLLGAAPAWAHSQLDASNPADGASVATSPPAVSLTFNEDVQAGFTVITLIGPDGKDYHSGDVTETDQTVTVNALPLGPAGVYQIGYRVVSADGHPVSGKTSFTLTAAGPGSADAQVPAATAAPNAVPSAAPPEPEGTPVWPWIVGAVVLVGAGVVLALRLGRVS